MLSVVLISAVSSLGGLLSNDLTSAVSEAVGSIPDLTGAVFSVVSSHGQLADYSSLMSRSMIGDGRKVL